MNTRILTKDEIVIAISNTISMQAAARYIKCSYSLFKKYATKYELFKPNPSGRGTIKPKKFKSSAEVFIKGKFISGSALRRWYLRENENKCQKCGISNWQNKPLTIELDHINGDRYDNRIENLRLLCPNCHSQTENYKSKNKKRYACGSPTNRSAKYSFQDKINTPV